MRFLACFDLKYLPLEELLCCMGVVEYHRNDSQIGLLMIIQLKKKHLIRIS